MGGYTIQNQTNLHFLTCTVVSWADVFTRKRYCETVLDSLQYCKEHKGLRVHAFVIMSNHLHLIVSARESYKLSSILRDFKKFTAKEILRQIIEDSGESRQEWLIRLFKYHAKFNQNNKTYQFWKRGYHPVELISPKWIMQRIHYIHMNPVKAGIVNSPEDYVWSSASHYAGKSSIFEIDEIDFGSGIGYIHI